MSNHPNRNKNCALTNTANPNPSIIKDARGVLTQKDAANIVYSSMGQWQRWETGVNRMHPAIFELFLIKQGLK